MTIFHLSVGCLVFQIRWNKLPDYTITRLGSRRYIGRFWRLAVHFERW